MTLWKTIKVELLTTKDLIEIFEKLSSYRPASVREFEAIEMAMKIRNSLIDWSQVEDDPTIDQFIRERIEEDLNNSISAYIEEYSI